MFSELPKLLDRDFAVGYFLPFASFISANIVLINLFGLFPSLLAFLGSEILLGTTIIGLISWLGGIILLVANRSIIRILEGYGRYNPFKFFHRLEIRRYKRLQSSISELDDEYKKYLSDGTEFPQELRTRRNKLLKESAERFPDHESWLLPTALGNIIRAFEVYPRVMYGIDAIKGWERLIAVVPKDYRELIDAAKTQVDFWINFSSLSAILLIEYILLLLMANQILALWFPLTLVIIQFVFVSRSLSSAIGWGELVKSSFDMFLPELHMKLGFETPENRAAERLQWQKFSQAIIYRLPDALPDRKLIEDKSAKSSDLSAESNQVFTRKSEEQKFQ